MGECTDSTGLGFVPGEGAFTSAGYRIPDPNAPVLASDGEMDNAIERD